MKRRGFLAVSGAAICVPLLGAVRMEPQLRVLLGTGDARPLSGGGFAFDGLAYRGSFERLSDGSIVNVITLEEYLYSVVPREMSPSWPEQALQVQAICARTYVLRRVDPRRPYDIVPSDMAQVYEGVRAESPPGRAAVDATSGTILRYGGEYAQVAFSSCCGGHTESASDAWGGAPIGYLSGVVCPYCTASPQYYWSRDIALAEIIRALGLQQETIGETYGVSIPSFDQSGRARDFMLDRGSNEAPTVARGEDLRRLLGPKLLPSLLITKCSLDASQDAWTANVHLEGRGNGHGVGLCQWGARGAALVDGSVEGITNFYFPGTSIDRWTSVSSRPTTTNFQLR